MKYEHSVYNSEDVTKAVLALPIEDNLEYLNMRSRLATYADYIKDAIATKDSESPLLWLTNIRNCVVVFRAVKDPTLWEDALYTFAPNFTTLTSNEAERCLNLPGKPTKEQYSWAIIALAYLVGCLMAHYFATEEALAKNLPILFKAFPDLKIPTKANLQVVK